MPKYTYYCKDSKGHGARGVVEAASRDEAIRQLRAERYTVVDLHEGGGDVDIERLKVRRAAKQVKPEEVIAFSSQLAVMLETGVPLSDALRAFNESAKAGSLKEVMRFVSDNVHGGASFSSSLAVFPRAFPRIMVSLMRASEASGKMGLMLQRIAEYLGKERRTKKQIRGALTYPGLMMFMAVTVTSFLVTWVMPRFTKIYEARSATLPAPTKFVMTLSDAILGNWMLIVGCVAALVVTVIVSHGTPKGRRTIDRIKQSIPVIGPMIGQYHLTRATRTLATLLGSGVQLIDAIQIVRDLTNNALWEELWDTLLQSVTAGQTISSVISKSDLVPPTISQMIAAGERTGRLPEVLERVAEVTEQDLDESVKNGTQLLEPLMISVMGVIIGGLAVALLLPIMTIGSAMSS